MNRQIRCAALLAVLAGISAGCRTAHDVAVSSFRVIDAPAAYVRKHIDESEATTTTTTTTTTTADSDVVAPGHVVTSAPPSTTSQVRARSTTAPSSSGSQSDVASVTTTKSRPQSSPVRSPRTTNSQSAAELPTAKPVPGKPGYVLSPFDPSGGYVDVTGYKSGDKVKDPYTKKIFLVP